MGLGPGFEAPQKGWTVEVESCKTCLSFRQGTARDRAVIKSPIASGTTWEQTVQGAGVCGWVPQKALHGSDLRALDTIEA